MDVNGDGKADIMWIEKFTGDGRVWYVHTSNTRRHTNTRLTTYPSHRYNRGRHSAADNFGSSFLWQKVENPIYSADVAGTCVFYPDFDGNGRADSHTVLGTFTNQATTNYSPSCGLEDVQGDDPGGVFDPKLPVQPGNPIGAPGPGELGNETPGSNPSSSEDCRNLDDRHWRSLDCTNLYAGSEDDYSSAKRWEELDVTGAWASTVEYWNCVSKFNTADGLPRSFSNSVSFACFVSVLHTKAVPLTLFWPVHVDVGFLPCGPVHVLREMDRERRWLHGRHDAL